jgi:hypothetical protein
MRAFIAYVLIVFATSLHAADKDEDKAKEAAAAFLKGLKDKDLDAMMKTVAVPFVFDMGSQNAKTIEKRDELKETMAKLIEIAVPEKVMALELGKVYDMAGLANHFKDMGKAEEAEEFIEQAKKLVGKDGRMVMLVKKGGKEDLGFLIRFKDGKALIASVPK